MVKSTSWTSPRFAAFAALACVAAAPSAFADEGGVSFWVPGTFGSLAAVPSTPDWQVGNVFYNTSVSASGAVARSREITIGDLPHSVKADLNLKLSADAPLYMLSPTYVAPKPVLGGQFAAGFTAFAGSNDTSLVGTLMVDINGAIVTRQGRINSSIDGFGDLYPMITQKWSKGANNFMLYLTGDIPVGAYDSRRLANLGIGHGAVDGGFGYTYFNPKTGHEFSAVTGFTGNFENTSTNYTNGIDWHLDFGASQFLSPQLMLGIVGYAYEQVTADSGQAAFLGPMKSGVAGLGPQIGYILPIGKVQGYVNLKSNFECDAYRRPAGWNLWLTFALSPPPH